MTNLQGKIVLVTGASAGIGLAIAENLAKHGARVIACARNIQATEELNHKLNSNQAVYAISCDITKEAEVLALFRDIDNKFGKLDVLINNAGMNSASAKLVTGEFKVWKAILDLNVLALTLVTREAIKRIESSGSQHGHIVNINSIVGHTVPDWEDTQFYAGTKHMVKALTEGLRKSVQAKNIRVTSVSPGMTETEILARSHGKDVAAQQYSEFKVLEPKDVADAVAYALTVPPHVNIDELKLKSLYQAAPCNPTTSPR